MMPGHTSMAIMINAIFIQIYMPPGMGSKGDKESQNPNARAIANLQIFTVCAGAI